MTSLFAKELKKYTYNDLRALFGCKNDEKLNLILKKLKEYGILKSIKKVDGEITDLQYEDEILVEVDELVEGINYVFNYVGVVIVSGILLKCYPKYIDKNNEPINELKQILKVIEKYNAKEQVITMYNETNSGGSFNYLAIALYLLNDYYEYGVYRNDKDIIETNGEGSIIWDKTINETFMLINNNKPYYLELQTKKHQNDDMDFFTRLHRIILTEVSKEFESIGIFSLFDMLGVDLTDEFIDDLGDKDYISYKLLNELNVEFNTRKQNLLKLFYTYVNKATSINDINCLSLYGTQSFNLVWEKVCAEIFENKLDFMLKDIDTNIICNDENIKLIKLIEKPKWTYTNNHALDTLKPDCITIHDDCKSKYLVIIDAKYYSPILEKGLVPRNQPGVESITKQFLYQLAYKKLIEDNGYEVRNIFVLPTEEKEADIVDKGCVTMDMFTKEPLNLKPIYVKFISAKIAYDLYLQNRKFDLNRILQ